MIYLIEYDRAAGRLVRSQSFSDESRDEAEKLRLSVELELLDRDEAREVVLLEANNEHELRKTHRRYFERLDQLLSTATVAAGW